MVLVQCFFCSPLLPNSVIIVDGAKEKPGGGCCEVLVEVDNKEVEKARGGNGNFLSSVKNALIGFVTGKVSDGTTDIKVKLELGGGAAKKDEPEGLSWCIIVNLNAKIQHAILLTTADPSQHERLLADAVDHALAPLSGSDVLSIKRLVNGILGINTMVCVSEGPLTPKERHILWDRMPELPTKVQDQLRKPESWLGRILMSSAGCMEKLMTDASFQHLIAQKATSDLKTVMTRDAAAWKEHGADVYSRITSEAWHRVSPARRLAIGLVVLSRRRSNIVSSHISMWLNTAEDFILSERENLDAHRDAFDLSDLLANDKDAIVPLRDLPSGIALHDPASTVVAVPLLSELQSSERTVEWTLDWKGDASDLADAVTQTYNILMQRGGEKGPKRVQCLKEQLKRSVVPKLIKELGLMETDKRISDVFDRGELCTMAVREQYEILGKKFPQVCDHFGADFLQLAPTLQDEVLKVLREKDVPEASKELIIKSVCNSDPEKKGGKRAVASLVQASPKELLATVKKCELFMVEPKLVDFKFCTQKPVTESIAIMVAERWLTSRGPIASFYSLLSQNMNDFTELKCSSTDVECFQDVFRFAARLSNEKSQDNVAIELLKQHYVWADWVRDAISRGNLVASLKETLKRKQTSIPLSFLRFLASLKSDSTLDASILLAQEPSGVSITDVYRKLLLCNVSPRDLDPFLSFAKEAKLESDALHKLKQWLSSLIMEKTELLQARFKTVEDQIKAAKLPNFPDCLGNVRSDTSLTSAIQMFSNESASSDLVKLTASRILQQNKDIGSIELLQRSLEEAREFLVNVFKGKVRYEEVKKYRRGGGYHASEAITREAKALQDLLGCARNQASTSDAFCTYLRLIHSPDPRSLVDWAEKLSYFMQNAIKVQIPKDISDFCGMYSSADLNDMPVFGSEVNYHSQGDITVPQATQSLHHMVDHFRKLVECEEECWKQISYLSQTQPLIQYFRKGTGKGHITKSELKDKMNTLRMMCVTNRGMSKPVDALDSLLFYVFNISSKSDMKSVVDLLKSKVLSNVLRDLSSHSVVRDGTTQTSMTSSSIYQLADLFSLTESAQKIANKNLEMLKAAKFVISVDDLKRLAEGGDPFARIDAVDCVSITCGKARASAGGSACSPQCFQLAGGRTSCCFTREDMHALFVETMVQISVNQVGRKEKNATELDKIEKIQTRLKRVLSLAAIYHQCARLGKLATPANCGRTIEFSSQAYQSGGSLYKKLDDGYGENSDTKDIDDKIKLLQEQGLPWTLSDSLNQAKTQLPWLSFCPHQDVMMHSETAWARLISAQASDFQSPQALQPVNDTAQWGMDLARKTERRQEADAHKACLAGPSPHITRARVAAVMTDDDVLMSRTVTLLSDLGEWPRPSPTALFPCDESVVPSSVLEFAWRLNRATHVIESASSGADSIRKTTKHIETLLLCSGVVVTRPDLLDLLLQDVLLSGLDRYARAASHTAPYAYPAYPKILLVFSACTPSGERFREKLQSINNIIILGYAPPDLSKLAAHKAPSNIKILGSSMDAIACGVRHQVDVHRIRLGKDMNVQDLVQAVSARKEKPLCLDFGGDPESIFKGALAGALISLLLCGVVGQAQHAAEVLAADQMLYVDCVAKSLEDLEKRVPIFRLLKVASFVPLPKKAQASIATENHDEVFGELIQKAGRGEPVPEEEVMKALRGFFGQPALDIQRENKTSLNARRMPFVHNSRSLKVFGAIAARLKHSLGEEKVPCPPVLLSGDTGTGKTYVILKFLELLRSSGAVPALHPGFLQIYTLSAAFGREHIEVMGSSIRKDVDNAQSSNSSRSKVCPVVLDEITSSPAQETLSRLICFRETCDVQLRDALILSTCNPDPQRDSVFELTSELLHASIPVEPLSSDQERENFVRSQLQDPSRGPGLETPTLMGVVRLVMVSTKAVESVPEHERIGTISLRDSVRCASLMKRLDLGWSIQSEKKLSFFQSLEQSAHPPAVPGGWAIQCEQKRVAALACYMCYGMRVVPRSKFFQSLKENSGLNVEELIKQVQDALVMSLFIPPNIVLTTALKDNILAIVIAVSARLPLLCLGDDGTSKTLALNLVLSRMEGPFSSTPLLQSMMRVQTFHLQLSQASTAQQIVTLKKTVTSWKAGSAHTDQSNPCVCMEEMSMADPEPRGPLRALHDLLDAHQESRVRGHADAGNIGTGSNTFSFIATSNFRSSGPRTLPTGRALGNRLLVLAHETLPATSLVELAVRIGRGVLRKDSQEVEGGLEQVAREKVLEDTISALCSDSEQQGAHVSRLVPDLISIRSLLYYARALAALLDASVPAHEAQVRAFACHLQLLTVQETKRVWKRLERALKWSSDSRSPEIPTTEDIVRDSFQQARTRRPLLFLYSNILDVRRAVEMCIKYGYDKEGKRQKLTLICPSSNSMVQRLRTSASSSQPSSDEFLRGGDSHSGEDVLYAMVQLCSALESGGTIFLLNPEPMLDGIHALLNDAICETSTLQMRQSSEHVVIHPSTQLVLLIERTSALGLHRALLSRVAVVNFGKFTTGGQKREEEEWWKLYYLKHFVVTRMIKKKTIDASLGKKLKECKNLEEALAVLKGPNLTEEDIHMHITSEREESEQSLLVKLTKHYESRDCPNDQGKPECAGEFVHDKVQRDKQKKNWEKKEWWLSVQADNSLDVVLESLRPDEGEDLGILYVLLTSGSIPLSISKNMRLVDAAVHCNPSAFMVEVRKGIAELEFNVAKGKLPNMLLLDLTSTSISGSVECLALLGFTGFRFSSRAANEIGESLLKLAANEDCRVVIVLNNAYKCMPTSFRLSHTFPLGDPDGDDKHIIKSLFSDKFVKVIEVREACQQHPDWPQLADLANNPSLLFEKAHKQLESDVVSGFDTNTADFLRTQSAKDLRSQMAKVALRKCFPKEASRILFVSEDQGDSEQLASQHYLRIKLFKESLASDPSFSGSLRGRVINVCRHLCYKTASRMLQSIPGSMFAHPDEECITFMEHILDPCKLSWQQYPVPIPFGENFQMTSVVLDPVTNHAVKLPFFGDFLDTVIRELKRHGRDSGAGLDLELVSNAINKNFPTMRDFPLQSSVKARMAESLAVLRLGRSHKDLTEVCSFLESSACAGNTIHEQMHFFLRWEPWLAVAANIRKWKSPLNQVKNKEIERCMILTARQAIQGAEGQYLDPASKCPAVTRQIQRALLHCTSVEGRKSENGVWLRQVVQLWLAASCVLDSSKALELSCCLLDRDTSGLASISTDEKFLLLASLSSNEKFALLMVSAMDECDEYKRIPSKSIAVAISAFSVNIASQLLASTASRRAADQRIAFVSRVVGLSLSIKGRQGPEHVALRDETVIALQALRKFSIPFLEAMRSLLALKFTGEVHKHAMWLIVSSFSVPELVTVLEPNEIFSSAAVMDSEQFKEIASVLKQVFDDRVRGGAAVQQFLVRCLAAKFGERRLDVLSRYLPELVGEWVRDYLKSVMSDTLSDLVYVKGFTNELAKDDMEMCWPLALSSALLQIGSGTPIDTSEAERLKGLNWESMGFCAVPAALWCVLLETMAKGSVLAKEQYRCEHELDQMYVPAANSGPLEMLAKFIGLGRDARSINRCECGHIYLIGNCGQPDFERECPDCQRPLGGLGHNWAGNRNQQILGPQTLGSEANDMIRGIALDWFFSGTGYTERDLSPLAYRILCVLLLIPLAVYSPRNERVQQLKLHWDALKDVCGLPSDTDAQHFLLGMLMRAKTKSCVRDLALCVSPVWNSVIDRTDCETSFAKGLQDALEFSTQTGLPFTAGATAPSPNSSECLHNSVRAIVNDVQQKLSKLHGKEASVQIIREGEIMQLEDAVAAERFAPALLRLAWPNASGHAQKCLEELVGEVAENCDSFPILSRVLFSSDSNNVHRLPSLAREFHVLERLQHLPALVRCLVNVHVCTRECSPSQLQNSVRQLLCDDQKAIEDLSQAWEACRYGHRWECQEVDDLGDVLESRVGDVVWFADGHAAGVGVSRTEALLEILVKAHNACVNLLIEHRNDGVQKQAKNDAHASGMKANFDTVLISGEEGCDGKVEGVLMRLSAARTWLESVIGVLPSVKRTAAAESLVRDWLANQEVAFLSLEAWPKVIRAPQGSLGRSERPESALEREYQKLLSDEESKTLKDAAAHLSAQERANLLRRMIALSNRLHRNPDNPEWGLSLCLENIEIDDQQEEENTSDSWLEPVQGLKNMHIFHAISILRTLQGHK